MTAQKLRSEDRRDNNASQALGGEVKMQAVVAHVRSTGPSARRRPR